MSVTVSYWQKFLQVLELSVRSSLVIQHWSEQQTRWGWWNLNLVLKFSVKLEIDSGTWEECSVSVRRVVFVFQRRKGKKLVRQIKSILTKNIWLLMLWEHKCQSLCLLMRNINKMSFPCSSEEKIKLPSQFLTY